MNQDALGTLEECPVFYLHSFKNSFAQSFNTNGHVSGAGHGTHCNREDSISIVAGEGLLSWGLGGASHTDGLMSPKLHRLCAGEPPKEGFLGKDGFGLGPGGRGTSLQAHGHTGQRAQGRGL